MKIRSVIFDLDGTLLDTLSDLADSMNSVLAQMGYPIHPVDSYRYFVGEGMDILVRRAIPSYVTSESILSQCLVAMKKEYDNHWHRKTVPYNGIEQVFTYLQTSNILISVLSNKPHEFMLKTVKHFFKEIEFSQIIGAGRFPKKPDPQSAIFISEQTKIPPAGTLYVGDSAVDMKTAVGSGMLPAGALWGFRTADELKNAGAKFLFSTPTDIITFLDGQIGAFKVD